MRKMEGARGRGDGVGCLRSKTSPTTFPFFISQSLYGGYVCCQSRRNRIRIVYLFKSCARAGGGGEDGGERAREPSKVPGTGTLLSCASRCAVTYSAECDASGNCEAGNSPNSVWSCNVTYMSVETPSFPLTDNGELYYPSEMKPMPLSKVHGKVHLCQGLTPLCSLYQTIYLNGLKGITEKERAINNPLVSSKEGQLEGKRLLQQEWLP